MDPDHRRFTHWVSSHEIDSQHAPDRFRRQTAAMAVAGYAAIWGTLALCVLTLAWIASRWMDGQRVHYWGFMAGLVAASLMVSVVRALWMPFPAPEGRRLSRRDAPELFKLIDQVRKRTGGPAFDDVLIDGDLNAAVVQRPRLGLLGWYRNHLVLGLPLLMLLDKRQLASVIAHEFGHLSGAHGKLGGWVYRTRRSWMRLVALRRTARMGESLADAALGLFLHAFVPRFNARALVLGRQQEYEADRAAHRVAGAASSAQALIALCLGSRYLQGHFWPSVFARARTGGELQATPYRDLRVLLRQVHSRDDAAQWLRDEWKCLPQLDDTHPSLRQRLEFAEQPAQVTPATGPASAALLGPTFDRLVDEFDASWRADNQASWSEAVRRYRGESERLAELDGLRAAGTLSAAAAWERANCLLSLRTRDDGLAALEEAHALHPAHVGIAHQLGCLLAADPSPDAQSRALDLWTQVAASDSPRAVDALERSIAAMERTDRHKDAQQLRQRLRERVAQEQQAEDEHLDFSGQVRFSAPPFEKSELADCMRVLIREKAVGAAWLVRKHTRLFPERMFCVLIVERSTASGQPSHEDYWSDLLEKVSLPCPFMVIDCAHAHWKADEQAPVLQDMKRVSGARIYARAGR